MDEHAKPPFPKQKQPMPGKTEAMEPVPDHGEKSYRGSGRLAGKKAIITGADSGIGRAVAIAYGREGADVLISYLSEHDDAKETERLVKEAGRKAVLVAGDVQNADHCRSIVKKALSELGGSTSWSTTPPIKRPSSQSRTYRMRSGSLLSKSIFTRCFI